MTFFKMGSCLLTLFVVFFTCFAPSSTKKIDTKVKIPSSALDEIEVYPEQQSYEIIDDEESELLKEKPELLGVLKDLPLHLAVYNKDKKRINILLKKLLTVDEMSPFGTPLHIAVIKKDLDMVKFLLSRGANATLPNKEGQTPLLYATINGNFEIAKELMKKADVNKKDTVPDKYKNTPKKDVYGKTALHYAALTGRLKIAEELTKNGANVHAQDILGRTPLHYSAKNGYLGITNLLLFKGAHVNQKDLRGWTPLFFDKLLPGQLNVAVYLVNEGHADTKARNNSGKTPLHFAAVVNNYGLALFLLERGANINAQDNTNSTPLHLACQNGNAEIVNLLFEKNANTDFKNAEGKTAYDIAKQGTIPITERIKPTRQLQAEAEEENSEIELITDETMEDKEFNDSPLHKAVSDRNYTFINFLLSKNHSINTLGDSGTPLHVAIRTKNTGMVKFLLDKGANINAPDKNGLTPLHLAAKKGDLGLVKLLVARKAEVNLLTKDNETAYELAKDGQFHGIANYLKMLPQRKSSRTWRKTLRLKKGKQWINESKLFMEK